MQNAGSYCFFQGAMLGLFFDIPKIFLKMPKKNLLLYKKLRDSYTL
jgi:hypothetical protein